MAASATPKRSPERRGYMAVAEKGDAAGHTTQGAHVTLSEGTGQDSFVEPSLPLVDPLEDNTSIYVMLDEGCNTTCHGKGWRLHAERILANHGMQLLQVSQTSGTFKGVGASRTTGKWRVPFALQMEPTGALLHGDLESAELDSNDVPCLLSLTDQVQLGFVKNLRGLSWATAAAGKARQDRTPLDEDFLLRQRAAQAARSFLQRRAAVAAGKPPRGSR